jgi:TonB family protein
MRQLNEILLANGFLVLIWIAYELVFKHQRLFQANRIFLLAGSVLAVILPFVPWHLEIGNIQMPVLQVQPVEDLPMIPDYMAMDQAGMITASRSGIHWIIAGYWAAVTFLTLVSLIQLFRLLWWARASQVIRMDGLRIVPLRKQWSAFSFFRNVYYPAPFDLSEASTQTIIEHEKIHIRQWHSLDNIIFVILRIFFFYNPAVYLLTQRIRLVHEFIADKATAGHDKAAYSHTLISHQFLVPGIILMHSFNNQTFLKRRLTMLTKNKQKRLASLSYGLIAPMIALMVVISGWSATAQDQAKKTKEEIAKAAVEKELTKAGYSKSDIDEIKKRIDGIDITKAQIKPEVITELVKPTKSGKTLDGQDVFVMVEEMPTFHGGKIEDFRNWVQKNITYPEEAKKNKIQGTVYLSFVVDTEGQVKAIEIIRSANPALDNEVIRAMKTAPAWKPGKQAGKPVNVAFSIPIKFVLSNEK